MGLIGLIVSVVTFPGIIVHELAHLFFCRVAALKVHDYSLLRYGNPMGYVIHEPPTRLRDSVTITVAPFIVNTVGAVLLATMFTLLSFPVTRLTGSLDAGNWTDYVGRWLAISLGTHAFPSLIDAKALWSETSIERHGIFRFFAMAVAGFIVIGSFASILWIDVLYGYFLLQIGEGFAIALYDAFMSTGALLTVTAIVSTLVSAVFVWGYRRAITDGTPEPRLSSDAPVALAESPRSTAPAATVTMAGPGMQSVGFSAHQVTGAGTVSHHSRSGDGFYCSKCGTQLDYQTGFCRSCGTNLERACASCGRTLIESALFCSSCGARNEGRS
jgi:hypothetical protein